MTDGHDGELLTTVQSIYERVTGSTRRLYPDDRLIDDLHIDSVTLMELLTAAEDDLAIHLFDNPVVQGAVTVGDIVRSIRAIRDQDA